jgi:hypothetical protein
MGDIRRGREGMKKYSTSEAIAMLEKNPRAKLKTTLGGNKYELLVDGKNNNYFVFNVYTKYGEKISSSTGGGGFNYNIPTDLKWELIQQPVPFMEAVKAYSEGKTVECECEYMEKRIYEPKTYKTPTMKDQYGDNPSIKEMLEGKWYIKEVPNE